jgi:hypothetical protein
MSGEKIVFYASLGVLAVIILVIGVISAIKFKRRHHKADYFAMPVKRRRIR